MLKNQNIMDINLDLLQRFISFLIKLAELSKLVDQKLTEELHKPIIKKFKKRKVHSTFKDKIWGADLDNMQLISQFNNSFRFLLCVIDIFSRYAWVIFWKREKVLQLTMLLKKV